MHGFIVVTKNVVTHVVNQLQEEEMGEEYASDLQSVLVMVHSPQRYPLFTTTFIVDC